MALIKRYELKTGLSVDNAYHVITRLDTIKRVLDEPNINNMRPEDAPEYTWKAGYFAMIVLSVFASKTHKDTGNSPIAIRSVFPTGSPFEFGGEVETSSDLVFEIDYLHLIDRHLQKMRLCHLPLQHTLIFHYLLMSNKKHWHFLLYTTT
jgi:hypothetical protein